MRMLSTKKLLYKLVNRTNFRVLNEESSSVTIAANGTTWVTVPRPSTGTAIAVVGYYFNGGSTCFAYNVRLITEGAQFAIRNISTTQSVTIKVLVNYLVVD